MIKVNGQFLTSPGVADVFDSLAQDIGSKLRVCMVGQIVTYNAALRTATVQLSEILELPNGEIVPMVAPLLDVPVVTMQGGGVHLGMPVTPGDQCLVIFNDFNIDNWYQAGGQQLPEDGRQHNLADGFALVGVNPLPKPLATLLAATEGGVSTALAKVAVDEVSGKAAVWGNGTSLVSVLTTLLTSVETAMTALSTDPGLQSATKTAALNAATALVTAITNLGAMLQ